MLWESDVDDADKGSARCWANNATLSSATILYFDDVESNGVSINALIDALDDPTADNSATIYIQEAGTSTAGVVFQVDGDVVSASTYSKVPVSHVATFGTLVDGDTIGVIFAFSGDSGGMTNFIMSDGSTTQTIENGNTQTFAAGEGLDVAVTATDTVTYSAEDASATNKGVVELATDAETITGSDTARAVTPANLQAKVASATAKGISELATTAETVTGTDTGRVVTPAGLHGALAGLTDTTIVAADQIIFADTSDSNALKEDTVQGILDLARAGSIRGIEFIIDGGGSAITTGVKGYLEIPFACTINRVTLLADQSGSIVVDIWKDTYANYPPVDGDSITSSAVPTISSATKSQDASLSGWTTSISAGDVLGFNVDSISTCQRVTVSLKVTI
jgi:hypothetical protein